MGNGQSERKEDELSILLDEADAYERGMDDDSKLIDYLDDGWKIINVTAANPLALDNEAVVLYVIEKEKKLEQTE